MIGHHHERLVRERMFEPAHLHADARIANERVRPAVEPRVADGVVSLPSALSMTVGTQMRSV